MVRRLAPAGATRGGFAGLKRRLPWPAAGNVDVAFGQHMADRGLAGPAYGKGSAYRRDGPRLAAELGAAAALVRSVGGVAEYQVYVSEHGPMTELAITVEPEVGVDSTALAAKLERAFDAAFALRLPVTLAAPGSLPRFP